MLTRCLFVVNEVSYKEKSYDIRSSLELLYACSGLQVLRYDIRFVISPEKEKLNTVKYLDNRSKNSLRASGK